MGNIIFIKGRRVRVKPLHSRMEAIQKINPLLQPNNVKVLQEWLILLVYFAWTYRNC